MRRRSSVKQQNTFHLLSALFEGCKSADANEQRSEWQAQLHQQEDTVLRHAEVADMKSELDASCRELQQQHAALEHAIERHVAGEAEKNAVIAEGDSYWASQVAELEAKNA